MRSWRTLLAVLGALLLPVPLLWMLGTALYGGAEPGPVAQGLRVVPMLSDSERSRLSTYQRTCRRGWCNPPLACLADARLMEFYCSDSKCLTDQQCPEGLTCQPGRALEQGTLIRICVPVGVRKEGEACLEIPPSQEEGCERGLRCAGWCGRPCKPDESGSCPGGFFCADEPQGPLCLPTCESQGCPEGQHCIRGTRQGVSFCSRVLGEDCQQTPCPEGQRCKVWKEEARPGLVWMGCTLRCGPKGGPPCPEGSFCYGDECRKVCNPKAPDSCPPYHECLDNGPSYPWGCRSKLPSP